MGYNNNKRNYMIEGMLAGMCLGVVIGTVIGKALGDINLFTSIGVTIGMLIGMKIGSSIKIDNNDDTEEKKTYSDLALKLKEIEKSNKEDDIYKL